MNKKQLEITLSKLEDYTNKKPSLEQYTTPSGAAASLLWNAFLAGDIEGKVVIDAGCGNGILGVAALLLGAKKVFFVDVDEKALDVTDKNCASLKFSNYELINSNIVDVSITADTVVMNPPFGVQTKGLDLLFFKQAAMLAKKVYAVYKGDGMKILNKELAGKTVDLLGKTKILLTHQFSYHTKQSYETEIILVKVTSP